MEPSALGKIIRELREDAGIGQRELARRSRVDISVISRIESGAHESMTLPNLSRLALALGTTVDAIEDRLGRNDDKPVLRQWPTLEQWLDHNRSLTGRQKRAMLIQYETFLEP
jgi:transcriptional regulator with XRE-family HTH domain